MVNLHKNDLCQQKLKRDRDAIDIENYDIDEERLDPMVDLYRASILQVDKQIERLIDAVVDAGEYENTVVVFGDHGDLLGERGQFGHGSPICDELIRVPLLIRDPTGELETGRRTDPAQLNDLYPTLLELAGTTPPDTSSVSLLTDTRDAAFTHYESPKADQSPAELDYPESEYFPFRQVGIWTSPESKLLYYPDEERYASGESMDQSLAEALQSHIDRLSPVPPRGEEELGDDVRANLKDMGYL